MRILDLYFRRPVVWDYICAMLLLAVAFKLFKDKVIFLPKDEYIMSTASDLTTIALTLAGFVLTLLTVLITFKSGSRITKINYKDDDSLFDLFFATGLYFTTIHLLKNCVKSLIFISVLGYGLKLLVKASRHDLIFFFNIVGLTVITLTLVRSLLILTNIMNLQKEQDHNQDQ